MSISISPANSNLDSSSSSSSSSMATTQLHAMRDHLLQTLNSVQSYSTSLLSLDLQWSDLEEGFGKRMEEIQLREKQIVWRRKYLDHKSRVLHLKNNMLEDRIRRKRGKLRKRKYSLRSDELELEVRELRVDNLHHVLNVREEKLGLREKMFHERVREFEEREKKASFNKVKIEPILDDDPSYADIKMNVSMDGRALQMFLNGRVNDHDILRDEIIAGLQLSSDPAKLVLDAILGFYPEELGDGDVGFYDLGIVRKSCVLLLEQLSKVKPRIKRNIREKAMRVAMEWKGKMKIGDVDHYLEVVAFLQLVGTYGLINAFDRDELLMLFEGCACHDQAPELCRCLGFADDIQGIIQNLISRDQAFDAVRLITAFELVNIFPPAPILKAHLATTICQAEQRYKNGNHSTEAQIECINMKLAILVSVVKCIKQHGFECNYPVELLEQLMSELKMQKRKCKASSPTPMVKENTDIEEHCLSSTPISSSTKEATKVCSESTLLKSHPSSCANTEPLTLTILDDPSSTKSLKKYTCPTAASTLIAPRSAVNLDLTSEAGAPYNRNMHPQRMTQSNKRPHLASACYSGCTFDPLNPYWMPYAPRPIRTFSTTVHGGYYWLSNAQ